MPELVAGFAAGLLVMFLSMRASARRERTVRELLERRLAREREDNLRLRLDAAYREGRDFQQGLDRMAGNALRQEADALLEENSALREQLGTESIFSHAIATAGGAAIRLRRCRSVPED